MARTLEQIRQSRPKVDRAKMRATTERDIRRHAEEDGSEPAAALEAFEAREPVTHTSRDRPEPVES